MDSSAELRVELESAALKKELRTRDLVFTQILYIVGLSWIGYAGKLGSSHASFWVLALLLFYIPSCIVVIHLNRQMPLEGGLYQWAKLRFGAMAGFMVAWNIWLFSILFLSVGGLRVADMASYALGPRGAWIADSKWLIVALSLAIIGGMMLVAMYGLALGKWIHNVGGFGLVVLLAAMLYYAVPHWFRGDVKMAPVAFAVPAMSLFSLNILGKMCFGALSGFDSVGIFAGECKDPVRSIGRSVWLAAPLIGAIFILGTGSVLTFSRPEQIDLIAPTSQVISAGAAGGGGMLVGAALILIIVILLA
jgi:glutamate:GABA antiporter